MNKKLWVGGYLLSLAIVLSVLFVEAVLGVLLYDEILHPGDVAVGMIAVGALAYLQFVLVHTIVTLATNYKLWDVLQDGVTSVTPGKAIGFLFVPVYNLYWIFRTWSGYPKDHNDYLDRHSLSAPRLPGTVFTAYPVFVLLTAFFVLPILALPFVTLFLIARSCDAVNNLLTARNAAAAGTPVSPASFIGTPENPRSRTPIYVFAGVAAIAAFVVLAFGVFAWFNLYPKPAADIVPPKVGEFTLQPGGGSRGSFLGRRSAFYDRMYVSESGGKKKALEYNIDIYPSDESTKRWIATMCSPSPSQPIKDAAGNQAGAMCSTYSALYMQVGNRTIRILPADKYDQEKLKVTEASMDEVIAFAKALPFSAGLTFPGISTQSAPTVSPTTSPATTNSEPALSKDAKPDLVMTADEYYKASQAKDKSALPQYNGKLIQVTARFYSTTSSSVMLQAGKDTFWGNFEPSEATSFQQAQRDDRLTIKCLAEASSTITLKKCVLVENKKVISPGDTPDLTFTADEFWKTVASYELSSTVRSKKWDELRGKIIKITGKVKSVGGDKANLAAGENSSFGCKPDPENAGMFEGLTEGQNVTFLSVHGVASLEHCIVINK